MQETLGPSATSAGERLAYSVAAAATATGLGRTTLYALINSGELPSRKIGKRRLIPADDLRRLVSSDTKPTEGTA